jgi:hypothetical protein
VLNPRCFQLKQWTSLQSHTPSRLEFALPLGSLCRHRRWREATKRRCSTSEACGCKRFTRPAASKATRPPRPRAPTNCGSNSPHRFEKNLPPLPTPQLSSLFKD